MLLEIAPDALGVLAQLARVARVERRVDARADGEARAVHRRARGAVAEHEARLRVRVRGFVESRPLHACHLVERAAVLALELLHPVELELHLGERVRQAFLRLDALGEYELSRTEMTWLLLIGHEELRRGDGGRRHVFPVVAGIIPAARRIELVALLVQRVGEIDLSRLVLRMTAREMQPRHGIVDGRVAARERIGTPGVDRGFRVDIVADGKGIGSLRAHLQAVRAGLAQRGEIRLPQALAGERIELRRRELPLVDRRPRRRIDDGERGLPAVLDRRLFLMSGEIAHLVDMEPGLRRGSRRVRRECHRRCRQAASGKRRAGEYETRDPFHLI